MFRLYLHIYADYCTRLCCCHQNVFAIMPSGIHPDCHQVMNEILILFSCLLCRTVFRYYPLTFVLFWWLYCGNFLMINMVTNYIMSRHVTSQTTNGCVLCAANIIFSIVAFENAISLLAGEFRNDSAFIDGDFLRFVW